MKIQLDTDDAFFAGGNYDRVHLVNADKTFDDLSGHDSFWIVKVRKGTPTHDEIQKFFSNRQPTGDTMSDQIEKSDQEPVGSGALLERRGYDRLWLWFELSRAGWVTIPRVLLHEMPDEWQDKMAALLEEYEQTFTNWPEGIGTRVQITDDGHLTSAHNWLNNYRHPAKGKIATLRSNVEVSDADPSGGAVTRTKPL